MLYLIDKKLQQELRTLGNLTDVARELTGAGKDEGRTAPIHLTDSDPG